MSADKKTDALRQRPTPPIKTTKKGDAELTPDELKEISGGTDSASPKFATINWGDRKV